MTAPRKLMRDLRKMIEEEGCKFVGVTQTKHTRIELEHAGKRHTITASTTPKDPVACVNSVRQAMRRQIYRSAE